jgi:hypothetical protein
MALLGRLLSILLALVVIGIGGFGLITFFGLMYDYFHSRIIAYVLTMTAVTVGFFGVIHIGCWFEDWREARTPRDEPKPFSPKLPG